MLNMVYEIFFSEHKCKIIYCHVEVKLKLAPAFSVSHDEKKLVIFYDLGKAFFVGPFKKFFLKMKKTKK